ncbi:MAG: branched-chain amino acid ABC transporter permease [Rhodospirillales bacterium]|nr:MAG: branched-chain amino acid ABC transporter permease [Rhodospirillales bacterium]
MDLFELFTFVVFFLSLVGIYGVLALGLNVQWGLTGLFNIGIAGFFAIGAYTSAILTTADSPGYVGGFGLPMAVGLLVGILLSGTIALLIGLITLNLREDYLAIATIGIAEIIRLVLKNEEWLTNGVRGIAGIPRPFAGWFDDPTGVTNLLVVALALVVVYAALERGRQSPWGRVMRAIREREIAVMAAGKNTVRFRLESFVLGSAIMGLAGGLYAHFFGFVSPEAFDPMYTTFLIWVMLIAGGSGNNRGALLGALVIWTIWAGTEYLTNAFAPPEYLTRAATVRMFLVGLLLEIILLTRPQGLLPESQFVTRREERRRRRSDISDGK